MLFLLFACGTDSSEQTPTSSSKTSTDSAEASTDSTDPSTDSADTSTDTATHADPPIFTADVQPILEAKCAGCHYSEPEKLPLAGAKAYDLLVNQPSGQLPTMDRVEPGSLDESYLYQKLLGTQKAVGGSGDKMPSPYGEPLTADELATFEAWILGGALR